MSAAEQAEWDRNVALIGGEDKLRDLRVEKQFDPPLDQRQLLGAPPSSPMTTRATGACSTTA